MTRRRRRAERGSALVEVVWLGVLLLLPMLWIVLSVFEVQRGAFGACLMSEASLVADGVKAMLDATGGDAKMPITVKHRIGIDQIESYDFVRDFVGTVAQAGCKCSSCMRAMPGSKV